METGMTSVLKKTRVGRLTIFKIARFTEQRPPVPMRNGIFPYLLSFTYDQRIEAGIKLNGDLP